MNGVPRAYLAAAVVSVVALPALWVLFPRDPLDVGTDLARRGKPTAALAVWEKACGRGNVESCAAATLLRLGRGESEAAEALLAQAKATSPEHVWVLILEGRLRELAGKPEEARAFYEQAETLHPESGLPATSLAKLALDRRDLPEAERAVERALAAEANLATAHAMRGRVLVATSSMSEAVSSYHDAIRLDGMGATDWILLADAMEAIGHGDERLAILEDGHSQNPDSPALLVALGIERVKSGNTDGGIEALRRACDLSPEPEPRVFLGIAFLETGHPEWAAPRFEEALKVAPEDVEAAHFLVTAQANMGESEASLAGADKILARTDLTVDQRIRTLFLRARLHQTAGRAKEAMDDVRTLLSLDPTLEDANWLCGHLEIDAGRLEEAERCLKAAVDHERPPQREVLEDWARLSVRLGRVDYAIGYLDALSAMGALDAGWIRANPEFRALERNERFRLLMEGAGAPPPAGTP